MVHLTIQPLFSLLLVHRRQFKTPSQARAWQKITGELDGFTPMHEHEIAAWDGQVIYVPLKELQGTPHLVMVEKVERYLVEVITSNGDDPTSAALAAYKSGNLVLAEIAATVHSLDEFTTPEDRSA